MVYIKYMPYKSIRSASRNKRELSVAVDRGFDVLVFSSDDISISPEESGGYSVINDGTFPYVLGAGKAAKFLKIVRNRLVVYRKTLGLPYGIWSCHDLHSLKIAYFSTRFAKKKPLLVYDAHEFELGRNEKRSKLKTKLIKMEEGYLIKKCLFSIMVNDSIADEVQSIYKLSKRPVVVRNTPMWWTIDDSICERNRENLFRLFEEKGKAVNYILMHHGGIVKGRGIEYLIEAIAQLEDAGTVILGNGQESYMSALKALAEENGVSDRILFIPAVPNHELWKYIGAADISVIPIEAIAKNHEFSLPNKFFESIQSLTPIVAADLTEMRKVIKQYDIGLTFKPGDTEALVASIERLHNDKALYSRFKDNLLKAKDDLCWENEKKALEKALDEIDGYRQ